MPFDRMEIIHVFVRLPYLGPTLLVCSISLTLCSLFGIRYLSYSWVAFPVEAEEHVPISKLQRSVERLVFIVVCVANRRDEI